MTHEARTEYNRRAALDNAAVSKGYGRAYDIGVRRTITVPQPRGSRALGYSRCPVRANAILDAVRAGESYKVIANRYGITPSAVKNRAVHAGLPNRRNTDLSTAIMAHSAVRRGYSARELAALTGAPVSRVSWTINRLKARGTLERVPGGHWPRRYRLAETAHSPASLANRNAQRPAY